MVTENLEDILPLIIHNLGISDILKTRRIILDLLKHFHAVHRFRDNEDLKYLSLIPKSNKLSQMFYFDITQVNNYLLNMNKVIKVIYKFNKNRCNIYFHFH